jgi:hypothetical protein
MHIAMRRASGTPRVRMPTSDFVGPQLRSGISCAIRARLQPSVRVEI